jgi:hypothetical protein
MKTSMMSPREVPKLKGPGPQEVPEVKVRERPPSI